MTPEDKIKELAICEHQFFEVERVFDYDNTDQPPHLGVINIPKENGVRVICALCGEKRNLWSAKPLEIFKDKP